jgi:hypothetical protein
LSFFLFLNYKASDFTKYSLLLTMHKLVRLSNVHSVSWGGLKASTKPEFAGPKRLHSKVSVVALPGLMHLRIPFATGILSGNQGSKESRVDDVIVVEQQTTFSQNSVDLIK